MESDFLKKLVQEYKIIKNPTFTNLTHRSQNSDAFTYNNGLLYQKDRPGTYPISQTITMPADFSASDRYNFTYTIKGTNPGSYTSALKVQIGSAIAVDGRNQDTIQYGTNRFDNAHIGQETTTDRIIEGNALTSSSKIELIGGSTNCTRGVCWGGVTDFLIKKVSLKKVYQKVTFVKQTDETFPTSLQDQIVAYGSTAESPTLQPTKALHRFDCWTKDNNTCFDFSTPITEDTTLHAKRIKQHTVTFQKEIQGTRTQINQKIVDKGSRLSFDNISTPSESNYTFLGWFLDDQKLDLTNLPVVSSDITITAKFQPQDTTAPQVDNQDLYLFESQPISNIKLQASDQDNI